MTPDTSSVSSVDGSGSVSLSRVTQLATIVFCGVLPFVVVVSLFARAAQDDVVAVDFRQFYRAAETILAGESPYSATGEPLTEWGGPYPYPPLPALVATPLTTVAMDTAGLLVMAALVVAVLATLVVLDVRDWRCYGFVLLWPPVISAIQTGNLTIWLALACALAWRFRDRPRAVSASIGITLAAKLFLWPLVVWLAATRRLVSAVFTCVTGGGLLLLSWAAVGFSGFAGYPDLLRTLEEAVGEDSYTAYIVALDLGASSGLARAIWLALGLALLAAVVLVARRGAERSAFILAIAAALALTPIVWLHYFALLVVVVALAQPRLGVAWFVPLVMVVTPGSGHPSPFETFATLMIAALTIALALLASREVQSARQSFPLPRGVRPRVA